MLLRLRNGVLGESGKISTERKVDSLTYLHHLSLLQVRSNTSYWPRKRLSEKRNKKKQDDSMTFYFGKIYL